MKLKSFRPGEIWPDDHGVHINAHGGGFLKYRKLWYWYGEHKIAGPEGNFAHVGIHVYSSADLYNWTDRGIAFDIGSAASKTRFRPGHCVLERPKVLYCEKTGKFVMWMHYEQCWNYRSAAVATAVSDSPEGPFVFQRIFRPNPGIWPVNVSDEVKNNTLSAQVTLDWQIRRAFGLDTPVQPELMNNLGAMLPFGQESRDLTLFLDDDGKAYHIYASESQRTLHIAELTDDFLGHTGRYHRAFIGRMMEAPALFKRNGRYYIFCSDSTGWRPNAARSATAPHITGPWRELGNPACGADAETTYHSQSTYVIDTGKRLIYAGDRWTPENAIDGRYVFLPVEFENERPLIRWKAKWTL